MKKKIKKGNCGYINQRKVRQLLFTFLSLAITAIIFYTGIILYHNTKSIFTVIATVSAIPMAKIAVSYLVIAKYSSCEPELMNKISELAPDSLILADLLISSTEKILSVPIAVIRDNSAYLLTDLETADIKKKEAYVRTFLETEAKVTTVKIFNNRDLFFKGIVALNSNTVGKFDETIKKVLLIYSL